jgi:predicted RNA-binding Zn-ribbon protein involved in translation (DUF1610 family)
MARRNRDGDDAQATDGLEATIEAVAVPPQHPCPDCGSESSPHGEPEWHDEGERICSSAECRKVQPAPAEVERKHSGDESPRFPCAECGRETKVHRSGRVMAQSSDRVCLGCRKVFRP